MSNKEQKKWCAIVAVEFTSADFFKAQQKIEDMNDENQILEKRNIKLNNKILEYKSRFSVKCIDELRSLLKI